MKNLFFEGGPTFMGALTILLIITTAWFIYHFVIAISSKQTDKEKLLRRIGYGKSMGLFTMITGITGQMIGLSAMFSSIEDAIKNGMEVTPALVYGGIRVTMIVTIYGMLIYLFSLLLYFVASVIIEQKFK